MKRSRVIAVAVAALATSALLTLPPGASAGGASGKRFYVSKKPALKVELTIHRHHVYRANVSAEGTCSNGESADQLGLGIVGGSGLPIRGRAHRFNRTVVGTYRSMIFRGRVEGDQVVGLFQQMYREEPRNEGGREEPPGPRCGSGSSPKGEVIHFIAKRVGAKGVPPSMR